MPNVIDVNRQVTRPVGITTYRSKNTQKAQLVRAFVSRHFNLPASELTSTARGTLLACHARQVAMYLTHVVFGLTLTAVGHEFARDRSTVSHACRKVEWDRDDRVFDQTLSRLEWQLRVATGKED